MLTAAVDASGVHGDNTLLNTFMIKNLVFDMTDKAENRIASENGYRCVLTVAGGEVVYRN